MSLKDDLIAAKALIDTPEKWCPSGPGRSDGPCCAAVAARRVVGLDRQTELWKALKARLPRGFKNASLSAGMAVGEFNDHPDTDHADIMALFDRAIANAETR